jgi:hypothetical protein
MAVFDDNSRTKPFANKLVPRLRNTIRAWLYACALTRRLSSMGIAGSNPARKAADSDRIAITQGLGNLLGR